MTNEDQSAAQASDGSGAPVERTASNDPKPTQVLPSDRLAFDKQLKAIEAFCVSYASEREPVSNEKAGKAIGMAAGTIVVTNAFFCDVGLLSREGKGLFVPTELALEYHHACDWDRNSGTKTARAKLAAAFSDKWFTIALIPPLKLRSTMSEEEALTILAEACKAKTRYKDQLRVLLQFMVEANIISNDGGVIRYANISGATAVTSPESKSHPASTSFVEKSLAHEQTVIPPDAPSFYLDKDRKRKVVFIGPTTLDANEIKRVKKWLDLLFFVDDTPVE